MPLAGTKGASIPFWSPNSRRIGFAAEGKLRTADIVDGAVEVLGDVPGFRGGTWNRDGTLVFAPSAAGPLYRISSTAGLATLVNGIPRQGSGQARRLVREKKLPFAVQAPTPAW